MTVTLHDFCDRCGKPIRGTIYPIPEYLGYGRIYVCQACYYEICKEINRKQDNGTEKRRKS